MSFEDFYCRFPRKKKPADARKAYEAALKRATHEEIMAGLETYLKHPPYDEIKFCPYPGTWLRADSWLEEPDEQDDWKHKTHEERREASRKLIAEAKAAGRYPKVVE